MNAKPSYRRDIILRLHVIPIYYGNTTLKRNNSYIYIVFVGTLMASIISALGFADDILYAP